MAYGVIMQAHFAGSFKLPKPPHCTLIYLGETRPSPLRQQSIEIAVDRLRSQVLGQMVPTLGLDVFGLKTHTVIRLKADVLMTWRTFIEKELRRDGIMSASQWAYAPHVTINKHAPSDVPVPPWENFQIPATVWLDEPTLMWDK